MLLDLKFTKALRSGRAALAVLCEIDHPDGIVHLWTGLGTLRYRGIDWKGAGGVAAITVSPRSMDLRIDEVRLSLSGVDPETMLGLNMDIRNRIAKTWIAAIGAGNRVQGEPLLLDEILLDYATDSLGEDGLVTLTLIGQAGFWTLERSTENAWSREEAVLRFGVDSGGEPIESGYDYIPTLRTKDTKWELPTS